MVTRFTTAVNLSLFRRPSWGSSPKHNGLALDDLSSSLRLKSEGGSFLEKLRQVWFLHDRHTASYLFCDFIAGRPCAYADGAGYHRIDHAGAALRVVGRRVPQVAL